MPYPTMGIVFMDILAGLILIVAQGFLGYTAAKLATESVDFSRGLLAMGCFLAFIMIGKFGFLFVLVISVIGYIIGILTCHFIEKWFDDAG